MLIHTHGPGVCCVYGRREQVNNTPFFGGGVFAQRSLGQTVQVVYATLRLAPVSSRNPAEVGGHGKATRGKNKKKLKEKKNEGKIEIFQIILASRKTGLLSDS